MIGFTETAKSKSVAFVIYQNGGLHSNANVSQEKVMAIARYYLSGNKLIHQIFLKDSTTQIFHEIIGLTCQVDGIIFNYMHKIGKDVLNLKFPSSALFVQSEEPSGFYSNLLKTSHDDLKWKIKIFLQKQKLSLGFLTKTTTNTLYDDGGNCGLPCTKNDGSICRNGDKLEDGLGNPNCGPKDLIICHLAKTYSFILDDNEINSQNIPVHNNVFSLDQCINLDFYRNFRDSILYTSTLGMKYVQYYYLLSNRLDSTLTTTNALHIAVVSYDVMNMINILLDPNTNQNQIWITNDLRDELTQTVSNYLNQTTDSDAIHAMQDILQDLSTLSGQSVGHKRLQLNL